MHVDARDVMITDDDFTRAEPQPDAIAERARAIVLPLVREGKVPVIGGFIGSARATGITTTLGRGGCDYSASLLGAALQAEAIEIWTDVDGMLTADPRVVKGSQLIEQIAFDEASELASFGAKVLHPNTIAPAVRLGIPVFMLNSREPEGTGTRITFDAPQARGERDRRQERRHAREGRLAAHAARAKAFCAASSRSSSGTGRRSTSSRRPRCRSRVTDRRRVAPRGARRRTFARSATSRSSATAASSRSSARAIAEGGSAMARALGALGDIRVHMLSLSATGINLTMVVDGEQVKPAMQRLHAASSARERSERRTSSRSSAMGKMGRAIDELARERRAGRSRR